MLRILLLNSDATHRAIVARNLLTAGFRVVEAADPAEAIALFEREPVDLLIVDHDADPVVPGPSIARYLRALRPDLKVVHLSLERRTRVEAQRPAPSEHRQVRLAG